jgi:ribulose 1,5-bisphosphate synthetase/thiazole synthase
MGGFLQSNILTQAVITDKAKSIVEDLKIKKEGADETFLVIKIWFTQIKPPK